MKFWGKENFTDIDVPVTKEGIFGIVCKFYEPVIGSATKLSRPRYRVEYTETVEIWSIARFQVNPEKEGLISDFGHSCQGDPEFEKLLTEAEKELADMFGKPDFKLPTQIDLAATISRSAEGYFSGNKTTTFVEKSLDSE